MSEPKWKKDVQKILDKALKDKKISKAEYKKFKKALKDAKTIAGFVKDYLNSKTGVLGTLGTKKGIKWKGAGAIIGIMIVLVEAGPCPWTGIIVARINRLIERSLTDSGVPRGTFEKLRKLKQKYTTMFNQCQKQANGNHSPQDINKAFASAIATVPGVGDKVARAIILESEFDPFHTPWEVLRVPGVTIDTVNNLLENGFYFGISGAAMFATDEIAPDMNLEAKIYVEYGINAGPLVIESFGIHRCLEEEGSSVKLNPAKALVARLIDEKEHIFGYRMADGTALSMSDLVAEVELGKRNLETFTLRGHKYVRRPANDTEADNLSKLPVERYRG